MWRFFAGDVAHGLQRLAHADHRHTLDHGGVQLLELVELTRPGAVADGDQGRQRQHLPLLVFHVVIAQPVGVVAIRSFDLGNDFVTAAFDSETVDFRFAQQCRQGATEGIHGHPHLGRLGPVDIDHHLGFVEGQVNVEEGKLA
ncbi:hypothetical protein D3C76_953200 [compost metagenome]